MFRPLMSMHLLVPCIAVLALAGCATPTSPAPAQPAELTAATPEQMVALIHATAGDGDGELAIQPLRDSKVDGLRKTAQRLQQQRHYADAASTLDEALVIAPDDPDLLQERAEVALLLKDNARAKTLAMHAFELGSKVGPLCRRHWATVEQLELLAGDAAGATNAKAQVARCTVAGVNRF